MDFMELTKDPQFVPLHEEELEFFVDLAVNESQRWIEAVTRNKFRSPDFLESLEDGALLCELLETIWPCYLRLDDGSDVLYTRLYGQYNLEAFRAAAEKIGIDRDSIFLPIHIHAPERYICSADAQDAIQEALIRVTVTIYLLGWRAKETPTYTGPQLDLSAFTQLYQHYLYRLHNNADTLCNQVNKTFEETTAAHTDENRAPAHDERSLGSQGVSEDMPGQSTLDRRNEMDDPLHLDSTKNMHDTELYRRYYADSVGSCDSACGSSSPSMAEPIRGLRDMNQNSDELLTGGATRLPKQHSAPCCINDPLQFVKIKHPSGHTAVSVIDSYMEVDKMKQRLKEDEAEWQLNLDSWKSKRKSNLLSHDSDDNSEPKENNKRDVKTFPEMIERLKRQGGILASYLDDSINEDLSVSLHDKQNMPPSDEQFTSHISDNSEKDSSSGISSPRSSRSLTSTSPPPSLAVKQLVSSLNAASAYQSSSPAKLSAQPETVTELTSKRVVYLKPVDAANSQAPGIGLKSINNVMDQDKSSQLDNSPKNPNIETTYKPFGEKLAMFRSAQVEDTPLQIDPEKCSYKELVKPELSLKDKLSVFERPLDGQAASTRIGAQPQAVKVKTMRNVFETASAVPPTIVTTSVPSPPPKPIPSSGGGSGGLSRLLSKDLQNIQHPSSVSSVPPPPEFDTSLPEQYLQEIDGILGRNGTSVVKSPENIVDDGEFPPPPLPAISPSLPDPSNPAKEHEGELEFPSPPPPLEQETEPKTIDGNSVSEEVPLRRMDSTRRIKSEISKRRSDFFGIKSDANGIDVFETENVRPKSVHEMFQSKPAPPDENISKTVKFVSSNVTSEPSSPGRCIDTESTPVSIPSNEALISKSLASTTKKSKKKNMKVWLERNQLVMQTTLSTENSLKEHNIPIELIPETLVPSGAKLSDKVIILDKVEKVTEETRITGSFETTSREEMRSLDYMTVSGRAPVQAVIPTPIHHPEPVLNGIIPLHHYRDYSDGGYSSGRSDPGNAVKLSKPNAPLRSYAEVESISPRSSEFHPPRPPLPSEFKPPPFAGYFEENVPAAGYTPQYIPKAPSVSPPARMQPKAEAVQRRPAVNGNVQQHWVVQEAEMRRISEQEARMRQAVNPQPVPMQIHRPPPAAPVTHIDAAHPRVPLREVPTNYQRRVVELGAKHDGSQQQYVQQLPTRTSTMIPVAVESKRMPPRSHPQPSVAIGISATVPPRYPEVHYPKNGSISPQAAGLMHKQPSPTKQQYISHPFYPPSVAGSQLSLSQPKDNYVPGSSRDYSANINAVGVSSKRRCAHCGEALGRGAAMIVENLQLYYHVACFKCYVCGQMLGSGREGTDVRVRNTKLHCALCYSDEEGLQLSQL
ncbi:LIM and calponin homology domains-containing protein 1-like [Paramacrobiotus metropolitanus]|uniref:LIM and calponin homology domains-containing protein 1-like n=1 Tax=Paramacrobiotus metropolitanus TaxID=2943436 RepID=UPI0024464E71|nr:LIM and calponin homology domains-containing protein 1-like [Paramacrobiotus metropolitanus]